MASCGAMRFVTDPGVPRSLRGSRRALGSVMDKNSPFQTYEDRPTPHMRTAFCRLRAELAKRGLDGLHYTACRRTPERICAQARRTARVADLVTGSAGAAVASGKGRDVCRRSLTLQVRQQTDTELFEPRDLVGEGSSRGSKQCAEGCEAWLRSVGPYSGWRRALASQQKKRVRRWWRATPIPSTPFGRINPSTARQGCAA